MNTAQQAEKSQGIEYTVYTFGADDHGRDGAWARRSTKTEMRDALAAAEKMFGSGKYRKVEVKQKYFDKKKNRNVDMTLKVYQTKEWGEINIIALFLFALSCGAAAFTVTFFLSQ